MDMKRVGENLNYHGVVPPLSHLGFIRSSCSLDEDSSPVEQKRPAVMSETADLSATSAGKTIVKPSSEDCLEIPEGDVSPGSLLQIYQNSISQQNQSTENVERLPSVDRRFICDQSVNLLNDGDAVTLQRTLSAKLVLPHSPAQSESDCSKARSPKARFSPIRKMFEPIIKSKPQRSPLGSNVGAERLTPTELVELSRNSTFRKSLRHNFSNRTQNAECQSLSIEKELYNPVPPCSPAHLRGLLKLQNKSGVPFFEFSVKFPEDTFVAKTWKVKDALDWVYTFHSIQNRRKSSALGWGFKESSKASSMVGQMQVSCYLCAELKDAGAFDNSMITEFVLYDIAHARKCVASVDNSGYSSYDCESPRVSNENSSEAICEIDHASTELKLKGQPKHTSDRGHLNLSTSRPLAAVDLHPNFEIAAIVIQVPFEKRVSSKCKVKVVTPGGKHSLPSIESRGPSPLLDRWRLGGGCDCGGWDMACPLNVLGNPTIQSAEEPLVKSQRPLELFIQGRKDSIPALILNVIGEGQYAIDFHGQLSTLQAFSICVSILHATEASISVGQKRGKQLLQSGSLRMFIEEEVTGREKREDSKNMENVLPSFVVNPPFSPIARV